MDRLLLYLIAINIVTFLAFVIDLLLCLWRPELEDSAANSLILNVFPIIGGAAGMLLALFILTGLGRGHRINKDNIAWWFLAFACLIVWGLFVAARYGFISLDANLGLLFSSWNLSRLRVLGIYAAIINVLTFMAFVWDKFIAANGNDFSKRTPEARLLGLCLLGGSVGGLLAMHIVRHKTRKWYFVWGLPFFIAINLGTILYAHLSGLI